MPVLFSKCNFLPEIMLVSTGAVHDLAKYALLYHIEYHHFASSKTAVFQKHKRCLCLFIGFYQIPALIQCIGSPYFHRNCFPRIHSSDCDLHMAFPRRCYDHRIHFFIPDHVLRICIYMRSVLTRFCHQFRSIFRPVSVRITNRRHVFPLSKHNVFQQIRASASESNKSDLDIRHIILLLYLHKNHFSISLDNAIISPSKRYIYGSLAHIYVFLAHFIDKEYGTTKSQHANAESDTDTGEYRYAKRKHSLDGLSY